MAKEGGIVSSFGPEGLRGNEVFETILYHHSHPYDLYSYCKVDCSRDWDDVFSLFVAQCAAMSQVDCLSCVRSFMPEGTTSSMRERPSYSRCVSRYISIVS